MKKLLVFAIAIMFAFSMSAQSFGLKVGGTMSGYKVNFYVPDGANMGEGFHVYGLAELPLKETIDLRISLGFNQLGSEFYLEKDVDFGTGTAVPTVTDMTSDISYIQLSVTPKFKFGDMVYAFVGPYFGYAVSGVQNFSYTVDGTVMAEAKDIDIFGDVAEGGSDDYYNKVDFGMNLGFGANFNSFFAELSAGMGMLNFVNTDSKYYSMSDQADPDDPTKPMSEDIKQKNVFFGLSLGYMFGGK